jgi:membrane protein implicated in regulation of membrane protease activity
MDDTERMQFKGMFTANVILLNILILAIAMAVALSLIAPASWTPKWPVVIICILTAVVTLVFFIRKYRSTKAWLEIHGTTKEERMALAAKEREAERARIRAELEEELREEIEKRDEKNA